MTADRECRVSIALPGSTRFSSAGRLQLSRTEDGLDRCRFRYSRRYLERPDAVELDPLELRLSSKVYETSRENGNFGAIRDSMPDCWGRRVLEMRTGKAGFDELDHLLLGPDDRAGALAFSQQNRPPRARRRFNRSDDLPRLQHIADEVIANNPKARGICESHGLDAAQCCTSMGGTRPKAVVEHEDHLWLAKFNRPGDRWNHPRVEHGLLRLAGACGLRPAFSKVKRTEGRDVLLVRRFDRQRTDGGYHRSRMISALTLLRTDDRESHRWRWSYPALADEVRRFSAQPARDLLELYGRMCFSILVSNLDDYPCNHALVAPGRGWRLSPAFDLMPVPPNGNEQRNLAMICGPAGRKADRANALGSANRFLLEADEARNVYDRLAEKVRGDLAPDDARIRREPARLRRYRSRVRVCRIPELTASPRRAYIDPGARASRRCALPPDTGSRP